MLNNDTYENTILSSINLRNNTNTIVAIARAFTRIIYGYDNISKEWLENLTKKLFS